MKKYWVLSVLFVIGLIWSGINPKDYFTWLLEIFPALIGFAVLVFTFTRFKFTTLVYTLILVHCWVLFVGGHYTYAEVPLFDYIRDIFHQSRNNYDKVGHFTQGFVPAMVAREILVRKNIINGKGWLSFVVVCICLSISAVYEFIEWFVAIGTGESADAFLGTQGYIWDTQSDMLYATIGAFTAILLLSKLQDKLIAKYQ